MALRENFPFPPILHQHSNACGRRQQRASRHAVRHHAADLRVGTGLALPYPAYRLLYQLEMRINSWQHPKVFPGSPPP